MDLLDRDATLASLIHREQGDPVGRMIEVLLAAVVGAHDRSGVSAQLEGHVLPRDRVPDPPADNCLAGEGDHGKAWILHVLGHLLVRGRADRPGTHWRLSLGENLTEKERTRGVAGAA
jgi:hypothetical protein